MKRIEKAEPRMATAEELESQKKYTEKVRAVVEELTEPKACEIGRAHV